MHIKTINLKIPIVLFILLAMSAFGCGHGNKLTMRHQVHIPKPHDEGYIASAPEPVRYVQAYEAFWWRCIEKKANDIKAPCPFMCSGTPAATAGCRDGAIDSEKRIEKLVKQFGPEQVKAYLFSLLGSGEHSAATSPYGGPDLPQGIKIK